MLYQSGAAWAPPLPRARRSLVSPANLNDNKRSVRTDGFGLPAITPETGMAFGPAETVGYSEIPRRPPVELEIVMPVHNQEERLPEALRLLVAALEGASFSSAVVVVDTGSSDRTVDIAAGWPGKRVPIHLLGCSRRDRGTAVLEGVVTSQARFVGLCDVGTAILIGRLGSVMPLLQDGAHVVAFSYDVCRREALHLSASDRLRIAASRLMPRRHSAGQLDRRRGFSFFQLSAALPLLSTCVSDRLSLDFDAVALAGRVGLQGTEL